MIKESKDRQVIKDRVMKWMSASAVHKQRDALDMIVLETFFYIYNSLEHGINIQEIGNELGVFPVP